GQALEDGGLTAGADTRETCPVGHRRRGHPSSGPTGGSLARRQSERPPMLASSDRHDETPEVNAPCRTAPGGASANSASNCEISRIKSSKTRWRSAASEPIVISATVLASAVMISSTSMASFSPLNEPYSA